MKPSIVGGAIGSRPIAGPMTDHDRGAQHHSLVGLDVAPVRPAAPHQHRERDDHRQRNDRPGQRIGERRLVGARDLPHRGQVHDRDHQASRAASSACRAACGSACLRAAISCVWATIAAIHKVKTMPCRMTAGGKRRIGPRVRRDDASQIEARPEAEQHQDHEEERHARIEFALGRLAVGRRCDDRSH